MLRWLLLTVVMLYAAIFAAFNLQMVTITMPMFGRTYHTELSLVVLIALGLGVLIWAIISLFGSLEQKSRYRKLQRRNQELNDELTRLRNLSVLDDHDLYGSQNPKGESTASKDTPVTNLPEIRSKV
jgi:uncharacterized integral membrane protein